MNAISLGQRYKASSGQYLWKLRPDSMLLYNESTGMREATSGVQARCARPPLNVVTDGIQKSFGIGPVMGMDPEVFLAKGDERIAAYKVLPDKNVAKAREHDLNAPFHKEWFWDGFQAETQVPQCSCHTSLAMIWEGQLKKLRKHGLRPVPGSVWRVPDADLESANEAHVGLGCSPSYNAYGTRSRCVQNPRELKIRFAGGHLHFECDLAALEKEGVTAPYIVKALDAFIGVPSVAFFAKYDNPLRRRYYGLAGEFRTPKHGLEYRVLSNGWLMHPQAFELVTDLARHAFNLGRTRLRRIYVGSDDMIRNTIDYCDARSARELMKLNREFYDAWLDARYGCLVGPSYPMYQGGKKSFWGAIEGGFENVLDGFGVDPLTSWNLGVDVCNYSAKELWNNLP